MGEHRPHRDDRAGQVEPESERHDEGAAQQRACDGQRQADDEDDQRAARRGHRAVEQPGAKDGGPQRDQGPQQGQADPAQHVDERVRQEQPVVERPGGVPGEQHAERGPDGERGRGGHVVADGDREARAERPHEPDGQVRAVPYDRGGHRHRPGQDEEPGVGEVPGDHGGRPAVAQGEPDRLAAAARRASQEGRGEVLAPHEHRVGEGAEEEQVEHEPAGRRHPGVDEDGEDQER